MIGLPYVSSLYLESLLCLADQYDDDMLKVECSFSLQDLISRDNVSLFMQFAETHHNPLLKGICCYALRHMGAIGGDLDNNIQLIETKWTFGDDTSSKSTYHHGSLLLDAHQVLDTLLDIADEEKEDNLIAVFRFLAKRSLSSESRAHYISCISKSALIGNDYHIVWTSTNGKVLHLSRKQSLCIMHVLHSLLEEIHTDKADKQAWGRVGIFDFLGHFLDAILSRKRSNDRKENEEDEIRPGKDVDDLQQALGKLSIDVVKLMFTDTENHAVAKAHLHQITDILYLLVGSSRQADSTHTFIWSDVLILTTILETIFSCNCAKTPATEMTLLVDAFASQLFSALLQGLIITSSDHFTTRTLELLRRQFQRNLIPLVLRRTSLRLQNTTRDGDKGNLWKIAFSEQLSSVWKQTESLLGTDSSGELWYEGLALTCSVVDHYFGSPAEVESSEETKDISRRPLFWKMIERGLKEENHMHARTGGLVLLRKAIERFVGGLEGDTEEGSESNQVEGGGKRSRRKERKEKAAVGKQAKHLGEIEERTNSDQLLGFWNVEQWKAFFHIYGSLDEHVLHLVRPVWIKIDTLFPKLARVCEHDQEKQHSVRFVNDGIFWLSILFHRSQQNSNPTVRKMALRLFFAMKEDLESLDTSVSSSQSFVELVMMMIQSAAVESSVHLQVSKENMKVSYKIYYNPNCYYLYYKIYYYIFIHYLVIWRCYFVSDSFQLIRLRHIYYSWYFQRTKS